MKNERIIITYRVGAQACVRNRVLEKSFIRHNLLYMLYILFSDNTLNK